MNYLLDTNTCIAIMKGNLRTIERLAACSTDDCAVSTISVYELKTGVAKCADPAKENRKVSALLEKLAILNFDDEAASNSARIRADLELKGKMIGPYDVLIAGQAVTNSLVVVTGNLREFSRIPGLIIEDWNE